MLNSRSLRLAVAPLAVAAALGFAACGGDDDGDSDSEETIALAEWITQADQICADSNAALEEDGTAFIEEAGNNPTPEQAEELASEIMVPALQGQLDDLRALPEPDESADTVDELLASVEDGIGTIEDDPSVILEPSPPEGFDQANELAAELGMEECGE